MYNNFLRLTSLKNAVRFAGAHSRGDTISCKKHKAVQHSHAHYLHGDTTASVLHRSLAMYPTRRNAPLFRSGIQGALDGIL